MNNYPRYVNVYLVQRCYGGPEEGGWWYDAGEPVASVPVWSNEEKEETKLKLKEKFNNDENVPISSVLSKGEYQIYVEDDFAQIFPKSKPYYE